RPISVGKDSLIRPSASQAGGGAPGRRLPQGQFTLHARRQGPEASTPPFGVCSGGVVRFYPGGVRASMPTTCSHQAAAASTRASPPCGPTSWIASGSPPALQPAGTETVGSPV